MATKSGNPAQLKELLYQALETEMGGVKVYETAVSCAVDSDLQGEWEEYLEQTKQHVGVLIGVCGCLGLDPLTQTPGRKVVAHIGASLVQAMEMAKAAGDPVAAELVAADCAVHADT